MQIKNNAIMAFTTKLHDISDKIQERKYGKNKAQTKYTEEGLLFFFLNLRLWLSFIGPSMTKIGTQLFEPDIQLFLFDLYPKIRKQIEWTMETHGKLL